MNFNIFDKTTGEDLEFIHSRLSEAYQDDTYEVLSFIQNNIKDADSLVLSAKTNEQFYSILDGLEFASKKELERRNPSGK